MYKRLCLDPYITDWSSADLENEQNWLHRTLKYW